MGIASVMKTSVGFRALENVLKIQNAIFPEQSSSIPTYGTFRSWLLRYGYYKLNRPMEKADDWILIQDHSVQVGDDKVHVILGIRAEKLKKIGFQPTLDDVEPLVVRPVKSSKGTKVKEALKEASEKIGGNPIQILADGGSDGRCGARLFIEENPGCILSYDIAHKLDIFLKQELKDDETWASFKQNATDTMQKLKQSKLSHVVPPPQRQKSRLFSEFKILKWGCELHDYYNRREYGEVEPSYVEEKIGWIKNYKGHLSLYHNLTRISIEAKEQIGKHGYQQNSSKVFTERLLTLKLSKRAIAFGKKVANFLEEEGTKVPIGLAYLGTTEVLESLFGKFKSLEDNHAKRGFGSLVLAIPALVGELTEENVHVAMEEVKASRIPEWVENFFGKTFLSRRRESFQQGMNSEQNLDEKQSFNTVRKTKKTLLNACDRFIAKITSPFKSACGV